MNRVNTLAALLGSATAAIGVLSLASPANAVNWKLNNVGVSGDSTKTFTDISFVPVITAGKFGAGSVVTGSFDFDGTTVTNSTISTKIKLAASTGFPADVIVNYDIFTPVISSGTLSAINFGVSGATAGFQNSLTLDFAPGLTAAGGKATVTGGLYQYSFVSQPGASLTTYTLSGNIAPNGSATAVPWETDSLPLIGSTILFGAALQVKRKLASNKKK